MAERKRWRETERDREGERLRLWQNETEEIRRYGVVV